MNLLARPRTLITQIRLGISNAFVLRERRTVLVDSGRPADVPTLTAALGRHGVRPADLSLILHTHAHWDHCGGTRQLKRWTGVPTAVHRGDADRMSRGVNGPLRPTGPVGALLRRFLDHPFPPVQPDLVFEELDLRPFGVEARVVPTPGHSAGSVTILTAEEAIVGDLLMGGYAAGKLWPHVPTLHYFAEDLSLLRTSIGKLLEYGPARVYTGHGGPLDLAAIRRRFG
ncbi:MAG: MBL fold metallo-hydrolase [Planctomycetes bacterium]|nr:MBL fold metallo-hydrolase [Planctomycetota bacterium]